MFFVMFIVFGGCFDFCSLMALQTYPFKPLFDLLVCLQFKSVYFCACCVLVFDMGVEGIDFFVVIECCVRGANIVCMCSYSD